MYRPDEGKEKETASTTEDGNYGGVVPYGGLEGGVKHYIPGNVWRWKWLLHFLFPFGYKGENNQELVLNMFEMSIRCFIVDTT